MDIKKIFQPKIWYIVCGAAALLGGIENIINAETWAESAWGSYNDQSIAHETFFGLIFAGFGLMSFVSAFVLSGTMQAKFAMANGGVMLLIFIMIFVVLPTTGYNLPLSCLANSAIYSDGGANHLWLSSHERRRFSFRIRLKHEYPSKYLAQLWLIVIAIAHTALSGRNIQRTEKWGRWRNCNLCTAKIILLAIIGF